MLGPPRSTAPRPPLLAAARGRKHATLAAPAPQRCAGPDRLPSGFIPPTLLPLWVAGLVTRFAGVGELVTYFSRPHHPAIREWSMPASCPVILAAANLYSLVRYLVPGNKP